VKNETAALMEKRGALRVGLITDDFSWLHDMVHALGDEGITFILVDPEGGKMGSLDVLITHGIPKGKITGPGPRVVEGTSEIRGTVERAVAAGFGAVDIDTLIIGIDPGKRPGIAVIADGTLISARSSSGIEDTLSWVRMLKLNLSPGRTLVRVGNGDPRRGKMIFSGLLDMGMETEIVNEKSTSRSRRYRDQNAAIMIARNPVVSPVGSPIKQPDRKTN